MTFGVVTTVFAGAKDGTKLLEEAGRVREKQPVFSGHLPGHPGVSLKIDLQEVLETKQAGQEKGAQIKGILSSYSEQDLIQKFF